VEVGVSWALILMARPLVTILVFQCLLIQMVTVKLLGQTVMMVPALMQTMQEFTITVELTGLQLRTDIDGEAEDDWFSRSVSLDSALPIHFNISSLSDP